MQNHSNSSPFTSSGRALNGQQNQCAISTTISCFGGDVKNQGANPSQNARPLVNQRFLS